MSGRLLRRRAMRVIVAANGTFETVYDVPNHPVFVGFVFHLQVAALELAPSGAITALTSTNALSFTEGMF
jgi:hypothetical protein